jgi:hypothetical protein
MKGGMHGGSVDMLPPCIPVLLSVSSFSDEELEDFDDEDLES